MSTKIGVYVCHCGTNISGKVNVAEVAEFAKTLPNVAIARDYKFMCSDPGQELIQEDIKNLGLDRVVVAACSPLMHEPTFRGACERANLNRYLFEMANIREHCSWVTVDPNMATDKAKALVAGAVAKAGALVSLPQKESAGKSGDADSRRRYRGNPGGSRHSGLRPHGVPGRKRTHDRRAHGPVRQDLPHAGLRGLHSDTQDGAGRQAPEYQTDGQQRSGGSQRIRRQLQGQSPAQGHLCG